jgi:hypothetical protein|tara:strand:+ start:764 stop:2338 length:1575 start_codon:yes stop_codon:yes gene_type:complete
MKKTIFLSIFIAMYINIQAQEERCATLSSLNEISLDPFSSKTDPEFLATFDPAVFNIYFWQVNDANGNNNFPLTEQIVLNAVANLNIEFNPSNIFFKYIGFGELDSPENVLYINWEDGDGDGEKECVSHPEIEDSNGYGILNHCQTDNLFAYAKSIDAFKEDAFNVYVPFGTDNFGGKAKGLLTTTSFVPTSNLTNPVLIHEVGHNLALSHTHDDWVNSQGVYDEDYNNCEHVTRDPDNGEYNANTTSGDGVPDTASVPDFGREYCVLNDTEADCSTHEAYRHHWIDGCTYNGENSDCQGTLYDIYDSDVQNFMAYTKAECRNNFSIGQSIRMQEGIAFDPYGEMEVAKIDIASLYEPYKGEYYIVGPLPNNYVQPHFQPGFEYRFVECESPLSTPEPYSTSNTFPFNITNVLLHIAANEGHHSLIVHPNHTAIGIVSTGALNNGFWPRPKKCYDNWNKAPSGGSVIKFNDDVFNTNVTITSQDSISINNPQLIDNLASGLYKIEKNYDDGSSQETILIKENND